MTKAKEPKALKAPEQIEVKKLKLENIELVLLGTAPLIMHAWSAKAKKEMLDKQMKKAKVAKAAKDPQKDFEESIYKDEYGLPCFPSVAFKAAAVNAAISMDFKKTNLRQSFHVNGEMVPIYSDEAPRCREDMVRVGMGTADIRYRAEFLQWGAILPITLNASLLSIEQLYNLFEAAGFGIGVGDWRPERDGSHGMFKVADEQETSLIKRWVMKRNSDVAKIVKNTKGKAAA